MRRYRPADIRIRRIVEAINVPPKYASQSFKPLTRRGGTLRVKADIHPPGERITASTLWRENRSWNMVLSEMLRVVIMNGWQLSGFKSRPEDGANWSKAATGGAALLQAAPPARVNLRPCPAPEPNPPEYPQYAQGRRKVSHSLGKRRLQLARPQITGNVWSMRGGWQGCARLQCWRHDRKVAEHR